MHLHSRAVASNPLTCSFGGFDTLWLNNSYFAVAVSVRHAWLALSSSLGAEPSNIESRSGWDCWTTCQELFEQHAKSL